MAPSLVIDNLVSYSIQIAMLVSAAGLLAALLRLRNPSVLYRGWQCVLAICVALPLLQPWHSQRIARTSTTLGAAKSILGTPASGFDFSSLLLAVIAAGILVRLGWLLIGYTQLQRYRRSPKLDPLPETLAQFRQDWGPNADVHLLSRLEGAVSFGLRRPAVLLPYSFLTMDLPAQRAVLFHELLHIRRRDWAFALAEEIVRSVLWFHPAIYWTIDRIQLAREQIVDRDVILLLGGRESYLETLLATAATQSRPGLAAASTFLRTRHLRERVALVLKEDTMSKTRLILSTVVLTTLVLMAGVWAGWSFPLQAPGPLQGPERLAKKLYKVGGDVSSPRLLQKIEPEYTQEAKAAKLEGTVVLAVEIGTTGAIEDVRIDRSLGLGLDENAIAAIQKWQFAPAMKDGQPVPVSAKIEVNYRLL